MTMFPLSSAQQSYYLHQQHNRTSYAYNIPLILNFEAELDENILLQTINLLAEKHPMLNAHIGIFNDELMNIIKPIQHNIEKLFNKHSMWQKMQIPFDLMQGPLIRFYHCVHEKILLIIYHHIMADDLPVFFIQELEAIYFNKIHNYHFELLPAISSYASFVAAEQAYLQSNARLIDQTYWLEQANNIHELDIDALPHARNPNQNKQQVYTLNLASDVFMLIRSKGKQACVSTYTIFTTALFVLLHKYTAQKNLAIGSIINNRHTGNYTNVIGDFTNTIMLHIEIEENISTLLTKVFNQILTGIQHGFYPYYELMQANSSCETLFKVAIVHHYRTSKYKHCLQTYEICQQPDQPLMLEIIEEKDLCNLFFKYDQAIFTESNIKQLATHYLTILTEISRQPNIVDINLFSLADEELMQLINNTQVPFPRQCLHTIFEENVALFSDEIAIQQFDQHVTYAQLNAKANQLARALQNFYTDNLTNQIIGIYLDKNIDAIITMLAVLKSGAAYLPLDTTQPEERIKQLITQAKPVFIVTDTNKIDVIKESIIYNIDKETSCEITNIPLKQSAENLAYVIFTSGTTGIPNGVAIKHFSVVNLALEQSKKFGIGKNTRVLQFASFAFDASISEIWTTLLSGGRLCLPTSQAQLLGSELVKLIQFYKIDVATIPPSLLANIDPKQVVLKTLVIAGESCNQQLFDLWLNHVELLINAYGPTEAAVCTTMKICKAQDVATNIGQPIANMHVYILDENLKRVPVGITGEMYIAGVGVAQGYLYQGELTSKKFINIPELTQACLYKTGDLGCYTPDGNIHFKGRIDTQIKIRGCRIELEEIEQIINKQSGVAHAIVLFNAENDGDLLAFILPKQKGFLLANLRQTLFERLPKYMLPNQYIIIDNMPLTHNGKVDRKKLLAYFKKDSSVMHSITTNLNTTTQKFLNICSEVLNIAIEEIDLNHNLFQLGGTSLSVLTLVAKLNEYFNIKLSIQQIFDATSLQAILSSIEASTVLVIKEDELNTDLSIKVTASTSQHIDKIQNILLTGVTGFIGMHLLSELLRQTTVEIYCLIRSASEIHAQLHLQKIIDQYQINNIDKSRIHLIIGDLSQPYLGLSLQQFEFLATTIDTIYHCGAEVNHLYSYNMLRQTNVLGTVEILKLAATHKLKRLHYISTIDTIAASSHIFDSEVSPSPDCQIKWGYIQSKWVTERILYQSNIPISIYRPGNVTGHSYTGVCNPDKNHALLLMKSCIESGMAPQWNAMIEMVPVDILSKAIVKLSLHATNQDKLFFNLQHQHCLSWNEYINILNHLGCEIKTVAIDYWQKNFLASLSVNDPLFVFKEIYTSETLTQLNDTSATNSKTMNRLHELHVYYPNNYPELINLYLEYLRKIEFIKLKPRLSAAI